MNFRFTVKFVKIVLGVFLTISLFVTFTQEAFTGEVSANFLLLKTPEFPVYIFIIGSFVGGLIIGLFMAATDHWSMARKMREVINENEEHDKTVASLEQAVITLESKIEKLKVAKPPVKEVSEPKEPISSEDIATIE